MLHNRPDSDQMFLCKRGGGPPRGRGAAAGGGGGGGGGGGAGDRSRTFDSPQTLFLVPTTLTSCTLGEEPGHMSLTDQSWPRCLPEADGD